MEEFGKLSLPADPVSKSSSMLQDSRDQEVYRCKKCRQIVACQENVQIHNQESGKSFKRKGKDNLWNEKTPPNCTSIFVQPMKWMIPGRICHSLNIVFEVLVLFTLFFILELMFAVEEGDVMGKLSCIVCSARLGSFDWAGAQCSCGTWVVPAFQLHKSRIDMSKI